MLQFSSLISLYKVLIMKTLLLKTTLLFGLLFSMNGSALMITSSFTGAWYNADAPGQGFLIQIIEAEDGSNSALVFWFTFDSQGAQNWLIGVAPVNGDSVTVDLSTFTGGILNTEGFDNSNIVTESWGTVTLSFQNCNKGTASYDALDPEIGSGEYTIKRLTRTRGTHCSGGTSDDSGDAPAENINLDFVNTGEDDDATGKLKFERNSDFDQLKIWYKDLPEGNYDLVVDGEIKATLYARAHGQSHQFFSSPQHENWLLLDFEVLGKTLEITQEGTVYLTVDVPEETEGEGEE